MPEEYALLEQSVASQWILSRINDPTLRARWQQRLSGVESEVDDDWISENEDDDSNDDLSGGAEVPEGESENESKEEPSGSLLSVSDDSGNIAPTRIKKRARHSVESANKKASTAPVSNDGDATESTNDAGSERIAKRRKIASSANSTTGDGANARISSDEDDGIEIVFVKAPRGRDRFTDRSYGTSAQNSETPPTKPSEHHGAAASENASSSPSSQRGASSSAKAPGGVNNTTVVSKTIKSRRKSTEHDDAKDDAEDDDDEDDEEDDVEDDEKDNDQDDDEDDDKKDDDEESSSDD